MFDEIDQRLLMLDAKLKDLNAINEAVYNNMVKDIKLDTDTRKITLTDRDGANTGEGIIVENLSTMIAEDLTGKDPDGTQDGVVDLDKVKEMQIINLDTLVK